MTTAPRMTLYAISQELRAATECDETGELPPDAEARLAALDLALDAKVEAICCVLQERQARAAAREAESRRLDDLAKADWRDADRLKAILRDGLEVAGCRRVDTDRFRVSLVRNSAPTIRLADGADIPAGYERVKTTVELDKAKVLEAHKAGWPMPEGVTCEQGSHVRVA